METAAKRRIGARQVVIAVGVVLVAVTGHAQEITSTISVETLPTQAAAEAKEKNATKLDAVQVTGSRIKRADVETETPVVTLTKKDLDRSGLTSIGDIRASPNLATMALRPHCVHTAFAAPRPTSTKTGMQHRSGASSAASSTIFKRPTTISSPKQASRSAWRTCSTTIRRCATPAPIVLTLRIGYLVQPLTSV